MGRCPDEQAMSGKYHGPIIGSISAHTAAPQQPPERTDPMSTGIKQLLEAANAVVPRIAPAKAQEMLAAGRAIVVDVRDAPEVEKSGKVPGAIHVSRGMLEFRADPDSPYHDKHFARERAVILYCASGGRSALAGKALKELGYAEVYNLGSFNDWVSNGGEVDRPIEPGM